MYIFLELVNISPSAAIFTNIALFAMSWVRIAMRKGKVSSMGEDSS